MHDAFRGMPLWVERAMHTGDEPPPWEIRHDPATATIIVQYTSEVFVHPRHIDHMTSALQLQLHDLRRHVHGRE